MHEIIDNRQTNSLIEYYLLYENVENAFEMLLSEFFAIKPKQ